jgi:hypothetical protein
VLRAPRLAILITLFLCAAVLTQADAPTDSYHLVTSGNWGTVANWFDDTTGLAATAVPGSSSNVTIGGNLTCTLEANHSVNNITVTSGSLTGGNILLVSGNANLSGISTYSVGTLWMLNAANVTLTAPPVPIGNLTINCTPGTNKVSLAGSLTVTGTLTMSSGTFSLYNGGTPATLNLSTALNMAAAATLDVGTGAFTTSSSLTEGNAGATITQSTGTLSCTSFTMTNGAYTFSGSGTMTVAGSWNRSGGTFTPGAGTVVFSATGSIQNAETFNNLTVTAGTMTLAQLMTLATNTVTVGNNLTLLGGTLSTGALMDSTHTPPHPVIQIGTAGNPGNVFVNGGTLDLSQAPNPGGGNPFTIVEIFGSLSGTAGGAINGGVGGTGVGAGWATLRFRGTGQTADFTNITYTPGNVRVWVAGTATTPASVTFNPSGSSVASLRMGSTDTGGGDLMTV